MRFKFNIGDLVIFQKTGMSAKAWAIGISDAPYIIAIVINRETRRNTSVPSTPPDIVTNIYQVHGCDGRNHYELREKRLALLAKVNL